MRSMFDMRKFILFSLILAALGGGLWWRYGAASADASAIVPVTVPVGRGSVELSVLATGSIQSEQLVSVIARQSGQLEELNATLGKFVKEGDVLARLEASDQKTAVLQAEADIHQIEAQVLAKEASLTQVRQTLDRARQLAERNLGSQGELEIAEAAVAMAEADLAALAAQRARADVTLAAAQLSLDRTTIRAPMDGTVITIIASEGQMLATGQDSATILKMADMSQMVAKVEVSEADVVRVVPGQSANLTLLGDPSGAIDASVRMIEPAPTSLASSDSGQADQAVYYNAVLDVANPDGKLRIGMTVQSTIVLDRKDDVLTLVASALGDPDQDGLYAVQVWDAKTGQTAERKVTAGLINAVTAEIVEGLSEGDLVVAERSAGGTSAAVNMRPRGIGF
jgi:membrane fusion protein, macrolide-specific efflux system